MAQMSHLEIESLLQECRYNLVSPCQCKWSLFWIEQQMLLGMTALLLPRLFLLQLTLENEPCIFSSGSVFKVLFISYRVLL